LFLKGIHEYSSCDEEPSEKEEGGDDERVYPLEGEVMEEALAPIL